MIIIPTRILPTFQLSSQALQKWHRRRQCRACPLIQAVGPTKNIKVIDHINQPINLRPNQIEIIAPGQSDSTPPPAPTRDLICSVFPQGVKLDGFAMGYLPGGV